MWGVGVYEPRLKEAWCCARNGFPQHCCLSGTRSCSCSSPTTSNLLHHLMPVTLADGGGNAFHSRVFLRSPPWHRRTGWTRTACCSGGDLRVTRAASPRSAWVKRTEQVKRGEGGLRRMLGICHLLIISVSPLAGGRAYGGEHVAVQGLACCRSHPRWSRWICMQQT